MFCCSKNILDAVDKRRRNYGMYTEKKTNNEGNELISICDNKVSVVNILRRGNESTPKAKEAKGDIIKKIPPVSKSSVLKYYEANILKEKCSKGVSLTDVKKNQEVKKKKEEDTRKSHHDKYKKDVIEDKLQEDELTHLNTKYKFKALEEIQRQLKNCLKEQEFSIHDDILFLNIYKLTHKKMYSLMERKKKSVGYYNCNEILDMIMKGKLHKNSLIKRKSEVDYVYLKEKIREIHFLKNMELQYYLRIKKNIPSMKSKFEEKYTKENSLFLEFSEALLAEKVKSLKQFFVSPYCKNIVEIVLIPKKKDWNTLYGYHKIFVDLFVTKHISVYFYHIIEKKMEKHNLAEKTGPVQLRIKLKTNYPQAIKTIFRYIYDKNLNLHELDFKLLVAVYMECVNLKILSIMDDVIEVISQKATFDNIIGVLSLASSFKQIGIPLFNDFARIISDSGGYLFAKNYHYVLDSETYSHFLSSDNLIVNEMRLFIESIKFIIKNNCNMKEQNLIFQNIRFNLLSVEHLEEIYQYIKNCFEDIIHSKYDETNFISMRYRHSKLKIKEEYPNNEHRKNSNEANAPSKEGADGDKSDDVKENEEVAPVERPPNFSFSEEIKHLNEFYKIINKEAFEPPYISKKKKELSTKEITICMNNIYNILFDHIFKKIGNKKEVKERCRIWKDNKNFLCVNDFTNENYSFQLVKKKESTDKYAFTHGDERLISECKLVYQIVQSKESNISIGVILKTKELNNLSHPQNCKIPMILLECSDQLVIYFDFFVNDFYVCNFDNNSSTLLNRTKLNIHAHENKLQNGDMIIYNVAVINQALEIDIRILPKGINFSFSFPLLKPTIWGGQVIKKPFIHVAPFFALKDALDSISVPIVKF
ncbi:conserved Plasmodium protein, unknown function [Plasmodium knowlesi strain H]|uniref:BTB domain-containing protein n=3 Tax=Plasmodium knowlesi TaxID=5850 RepID=A0A5K1UZ56_PLAKH|nr:conserved protein, unknown function [Plasmodium knowlesi strain H]OTN65715.1 Uncharacterized protein PKNOH_S110071600 [Plasmodium knowlesi]CAA9989337.1 conserved protein, unknown function [Plasmodium knowlesi strain H]SBO24902.1 conserved Plasmodium protein, unknown function [Plasmodium knowlesi strain H]SBO27935.1 conserved Plasmodium protein, unknown function [Plasmodium knowlesi strain H]VVS78811.1 conserved protein, unknown function [Plasmodium knowlesi strain H]|eukprot:XP_002260064.1 hypothetical protein, conserved in Plasmodium species [Plasmodium knowlesi strain H]